MAGKPIVSRNAPVTRASIAKRIVIASKIIDPVKRERAMDKFKAESLKLAGK